MEERLVEALDIPVFHDDQHGTAIVVLAALENALKIVGKKMADIKVVVAGVGRRRRGRAKILMDGRRAERRSAPTARARSTTAATVSTPRSSGSPRTPTPTAARLDLRRDARAPTCSSGVSGPDLITA